MKDRLSISQLKSRPESWLFKAKIHEDELNAITKICTNDYSDAKLIHHGTCHGCLTQDLSSTWCAQCYAHGSNYSRDNWSHGPDMALNVNSTFLTEVKSAFMPTLLDTYPELFI